MRILRAKGKPRNKHAGAKQLKPIRLPPERETMLGHCREGTDPLANVFSEAIVILKQGFEDSIPFYSFIKIDG
ncbi:MAG: hypothetical protein SNJ78_13100 [Spirochaetales bacterium]